MKSARSCLVLLLTAFLVACGGGGGGGGVTPAASNLSPTPTGNQSGGGAAPVGGNNDTINRNTPNNGRQFVFSDSPGMRNSVRAVVADNPIEEDLLHCTVTLRELQECSLEQLPLLGQVSTAPTVDDIMARTLVSHPWMGQRFRQVLETMPPEMLLMTRALTSIVISYDIRPSFYTSRTGAIYLDPDGLWLLPEEQDDISTDPDFRSSFGSNLQFVMLWRYVKNNEYATRPPTTGTRSVDDIRLRMAALLYHELAHANDFFTPASLTALNESVPIYAAVPASIASERLSGTFPLTSQTMRNLARVSFRGASATNAQQQITPDDVSFEFSGDFATDYYSYSTDREDFAMAFEEAMMLHSFGVDRDVGVTNRPVNGACEDYIVSFGQRNRVIDPAVRARALLAVQEILPEVRTEVEATLDAEDPPTLMTPGIDWCANRELDPSELAPRAQRLAGDTGDKPPELLIPYL